MIPIEEHQELILTKIPMPTAGAKPDRPAVPAIVPIVPRAVTVAAALPATPGAAKFKTSQHAVNYAQDKIYQRYQEFRKRLRIQKSYNEIMSKRTMIIDDIEGLPFQVGLKLRDLLLQLFNFPSNNFLLVNDGLLDVLPEHVHIVPET